MSSPEEIMQAAYWEAHEAKRRAGTLAAQVELLEQRVSELERLKLELETKLRFEPAALIAQIQALRARVDTLERRER